METSNFEQEDYAPCEDERDPRWAVCKRCQTKVYVSEDKPLDAHRHERDCPYR